MNRRHGATGWPNDRHLRVIALICAVAVVGGAWIGVEWLAQADRLNGAPQPSSQTAPASPAAAVAQPPAASRAVETPTPTARNKVIYKCTASGRTVYADTPCGDRAEAVLIAPTSAGLSPSRSYADQLAQVRAERARHAASQPLPVTGTRSAPSSDDRCAAIDDAVRRIDAITRQPLSIPQAEHYRARRKALMDERFSIGCNG